MTTPNNQTRGHYTHGVSRRDFLTLGAAGLAASSGTACQSVSTGQNNIRSRAALVRPTGVNDAAWANVREQFILQPGIAYMNNASLGMPPAPVVEAVASGYEAISIEPLHGKHDLQTTIAEQVTPGLAQLFGVLPDELSLTRNASVALHLQAIGVTLQRGDEVIITTQEHPAGRRPWEFRARRNGIRVVQVFIPSPLDTADDVVERIEAAITPRTRAIAFCHVTRGGHRYPVKSICSMARARNIVSLVDGAQAVGQFPIDINELGCDAYAVSLHKWMLAPVGTGFLYVRASARDRILTAYSHDATLENPGFEPPGTAPFPVYAAIGSALDFVNTIGLEQVEARCRYLSDYLKSQLAELAGINILSGPTPALSAPGSTIFEKTDLDAMASVPMLEQRARTHIDEHQRDGHNAIRVSTHIYNTTTEIDRLIEALDR